MSNNSWKQYGGISQIDNFTTINAGTIIADQFLSRTAKPIDETINGSIYVSGDVVSGSDIIPLLLQEKYCFTTWFSLDFPWLEEER